MAATRLTLVGDDQLFAGRVSSRIPKPVEAPIFARLPRREPSLVPLGPFRLGQAVHYRGAWVTVLCSLARWTLAIGEEGACAWVATAECAA